MVVEGEGRRERGGEGKERGGGRGREWAGRRRGGRERRGGEERRGGVGCGVRGEEEEEGGREEGEERGDGEGGRYGASVQEQIGQVGCLPISPLQVELWARLSSGRKLSDRLKVGERATQTQDGPVYSCPLRHEAVQSICLKTRSATSEGLAQCDVHGELCSLAREARRQLLMARSSDAVIATFMSRNLTLQRTESPASL